MATAKKKKVKTKKKTNIKYTAASYKEALQKEMDQIKAVMQEAWGFTPQLEIEVETALVVRANFNLKGFAHTGRKIYVSQRTANGYRKPKAIARMIAGEVTAHRNTCAQCGENIPNIHTRVSTWCLKPGSWAHNKYGDKLDTPADAVEKALHPCLAKKLERRLADKAEAERKQQEEEAKRKELELIQAAMDCAQL